MSHDHHHHDHDHHHHDHIVPDEERDAFAAELIKQDFQREAAVFRRSGMDRRGFLKIMGASLALAGFSMAGCAPAEPREAIIPYVRRPEDIVPGQPLFYASTTTLGGFATGVLIETHEGRPTRVEGNPNHPASLGGSDPILLASILELYNPDRSTRVRNEGDVSSWMEFTPALQSTLAVLSGNQGAGLRILTETITSPTFISQMEALLETYPEARWYQYDPVSMDNVVDGAVLAFDQPVNTVYDFEGVEVVLSLDADFMTNYPGSLHYARDFMAGRKVRDDNPQMNRFYAVESTPSSTGAVADHRLPLKASEVEAFTRALASALGVDVSGGSVENQAWLDAVVADLEGSQGSSIVIAGRNQPPVVHALAHAINNALGNVGSTVIYTDPVIANPANQTNQLAELTSEMQGGEVEVLFIMGGNPVFNAPADIPFGDALGNVPFSVHLSMYFDETSEQVNWHLPKAHYIEDWSDARAFDGTASIVQPPIGPLYLNVRSNHEVVALLAQDGRSAYDIVREYWQQQAGEGNFEAGWRSALNEGVIPGTAFDPITPTLRGDFAQQIAGIEAPSTEGLEIVFRPDPMIWDGRFASNSWLQELPEPITNLTWDNAALVSPATAEQLGVSTNDLVDLTFEGSTMQAPIWVLEGMADDVVTISLGYGRGLSADIASGLAFNAYTIRPSSALWFGSGLSVSGAGQTYELASTRGEVDALTNATAVDEVEALKPVRSGTLATFRDNPDFAQKDYEDASLIDGFEYDGYAWGMSIDISACIGCNACMIACQTENSIPTVGKQEVLQAREMYWIRVDRYYEGERISFQPVPCMHCENAPCEQVCPVQATVHDHEGLNQMVYNRCVGTRYCSANCPYGVRRFNFLDYISDIPIMQEFRNPDVSVRTRGVMEKCTYCVQRISEARIASSKENRPIRDGEISPACSSSCPTQAITFGDVSDEGTAVAGLKGQPHDYGLLGELNTKPRTTYLARIYNPSDALDEAEE